MASQELKSFLSSVKFGYLDYAGAIYKGEFTSQAELGAAERVDLQALGIPKGAALLQQLEVQVTASLPCSPLSAFSCMHYISISCILLLCFKRDCLCINCEACVDCEWLAQLVSIPAQYLVVSMQTVSILQRLLRRLLTLVHTQLVCTCKSHLSLFNAAFQPPLWLEVCCASHSISI